MAISQRAVLPSTVDELIAGLVVAGRATAADPVRAGWRSILRRIPSAAAWDESLTDAGVLALEANMRALADALDPNVSLQSVSAQGIGLAHARLVARAGLPSGTIVDAYHEGHAWWWRFVISELGRSTDDVHAMAAALDAVRETTFPFLREAVVAAIAAYESEASTLRRSGEAARRAAFNALLGSQPGNQASVAARLGLELDQHHLVLVAWPRRRLHGGEPVAALEGVLRDIAGCLGVARPVLGTADLGTVLAILSRRREPGAPDLGERLDALELPMEGLRVAAGSEGRGLAGLRGSFEEARAAREFAGLDPEGPAATSYGRVELASLLSTDPKRARVFVRRQLDGLAAPDPGAARLRDTLETYLRLGSNATRTAETLHVHKNTVTYRLRQAEQERGLPLTERPLELACALQLARVLPELLEELRR